MGLSFALTLLRAHDRDFRATYEALAAHDDAALAPARRWGVFQGLFGLGSNELFVLTTGEVAKVNESLERLARVRDARTVELEPTARPTSDSRLRREGLYVLRFFDVATRDIDEIVALSKEAWETFEATSAYEAEPMGLFRPADRSAARGRMLLVTWYDGLESWQTSRTPHPDARANFLRRHTLTQGTIAYATRLLS